MQYLETLLLCKMLCAKNDISLQLGHFPTAMTNGKVIRMPLLDGPDAEAITLAYALHESAHIVYSDFSLSITNKHIQKLQNILEDIRIEHRRIKEFRGAKKILQDGVSALVQRKNFVPVEDSDPIVNQFFYGLLSILRFEILGQTALEQNSKSDLLHLQKTFGRGLINTVISKAYSVIDCASEKDVLMITKDIFKFIEDMAKEHQEEEPSQQEDSQSNDSDSQDSSLSASSSDDASGLDDPSDSQDDMTSQQSASGSGSSSNDTANSDQQGSNASDGDDSTQLTSEQVASLNNLLSSDDSSLDELKTDIGDQYTDSVQSIVHDRGCSNDKPSVMDSCIAKAGSYIDHDLVSKSIALSARMANELQILMETSKRTFKHRRSSGNRLSRRHLSKLYTQQRPDIFEHKSVSIEPDTFVYLVIDGSGSMSGTPMNIANQAAVSIAHALESIPGVHLSICKFGRHIEVIKQPNDSLRSTYTKINNSVSGSTPLAEALLSVYEDILTHPQDKKLVFALTDGDANNPSAVRYVLNEMYRHNVLTIGVGINEGRRYVPGLFPYHLLINDINSLPNSLISAVKTHLTAA